MAEETREGITRRMSKEVAVCVQYVLDKENFLFQFEDGQKIDISAY